MMGLRAAPIATAALVLVAVVLAGCGGSSEPSDAEQVTKQLRSFTGAIAGGDAVKACDVLEPAAQRRLVALVSRAAPGAATSCEDAVGLARVAAPPALLRALRDAKVQRVAVRGDRATATVADGTQFPPQRVILRKSDGNWKIAAVPTLLLGG